MEIAVLAPGGSEALVEPADGLQRSAAEEAVGRDELGPLEPGRVALVVGRLRRSGTTTRPDAATPPSANAETPAASQRGSGMQSSSVKAMIPPAPRASRRCARRRDRGPGHARVMHGPARDRAAAPRPGAGSRRSPRRRRRSPRSCAGSKSCATSAARSRRAAPGGEGRHHDRDPHQSAPSPASPAGTTRSPAHPGARSRSTRPRRAACRRSARRGC